MQVIRENDRLPQNTTVATIGMFDGVHLGHATLLGELRRVAAARGLKSVVVTFAQHPQLVLRPASGMKMLMTLDDRLAALAAQGVDCVVLLNFTPQLSLLTSTQFMQRLHERCGVCALLAGYNHHFGHDRDATFAAYVQNGAAVGVEVLKAPEYLGRYAPVSSSIIRKLLAAGKVDDALHCLGRPFALRGTVVRGFHNGRKIGFPTANVGQVDPQVILPHNGAYAVLATVAGRRLQGMANVGHRPTLHNGPQLTVEVNLFNFDGDIYGQPIKLEFIKFLRLEFKLAGIDELRAQLTRDREHAIAILDHYQSTLNTTQQHNNTENGNH